MVFQDKLHDRLQYPLQRNANIFVSKAQIF